MGKYRCETWYYSPYPEGYQNVEILFICEFCLCFYITKEELIRYSQKCDLTHPPGDEVYKHERNSVFEIDGHKNPTYCENLSYLSKLFLNHKTLAYDDAISWVFLERKGIIDGIYCILAMPFYQRKGYGKFLITLSYELSLKEKKPGTPERPLSDLGRESYVSWWTQKLIDYFRAIRIRCIQLRISRKILALRKQIFCMSWKIIIWSGTIKGSISSARIQSS